jgi:hypothetical protein
MTMNMRIWKPPEVVDLRSFARPLMLDHVSVAEQEGLDLALSRNHRTADPPVEEPDEGAVKTRHLRSITGGVQASRRAPEKRSLRTNRSSLR